MQGSIIRVAGPVVVAQGLTGAQMYEVVRVGAQGLIGEVIRNLDTLNGVDPDKLIMPHLLEQRHSLHYRP